MVPFSRRALKVKWIYLAVLCPALLFPLAQSKGAGTALLELGGGRLTVELAIGPEERFKGLSGRRSIGENQGMLFVFPKEGRVGFWMYQTFLPLSLTFLDRSGSILEIYSMKPLDTHILWSQSHSVRFALETRKGWFEEHGVRVGDRVRIESSSRQDWLAGLPPSMLAP
jgi:uncharacterized membrane protein (UPF0127 family)